MRVKTSYSSGDIWLSSAGSKLCVIARTFSWSGNVVSIMGDLAAWALAALQEDAEPCDAVVPRNCDRPPGGAAIVARQVEPTPRTRTEVRKAYTSSVRRAHANLALAVRGHSKL